MEWEWNVSRAGFQAAEHFLYVASRALRVSKEPGTHGIPTHQRGIGQNFFPAVVVRLDSLLTAPRRPLEDGGTGTAHGDVVGTGQQRKEEREGHCLAAELGRACRRRHQSCTTAH